MAYEISITRSFTAPHQLRLYDGSLETVHSHTWQVRVTVAADQLDRIGVVMDFHRLERLVDQATIRLAGGSLNDNPLLEGANPSTEIVATAIARGLHLPAGIRLLAVEVWETPGNSALYRP